MGIEIGDKNIRRSLINKHNKRWLQQGLDILQMFCATSKLSVNTTKGKVIYVSKRGSANLPAMYYKGSVTMGGQLQIIGIK